MLTQRPFAASLAFGLCLLGVSVGVSVQDASAATLRLASGARMTAASSGQLFLPGGLGAAQGSVTSSVSGSFGGGIVYTLSEASGRVSSGTVPGTRGVSAGEPSLAQNPATGEIFIVFARRSTAGSDIAFSSWTGQSWTEPQSLTSGPGAASQPALSFGESGEAILAWRHDDYLPTILVRHFELAPSGPVSNYSFSELGNPLDLVRPAGGLVGFVSGIAHAVTDSDSRHAYLLLADAEREKVGLIRLDLRALFQGGGFNAPPVPVALISPAPQSAGDSARPFGERSDDAGTQPGSLIVPWRLSLTANVFAYYWMESDRLAMLMFRGGAGGQLITAPAPTSEAELHATAYRIALRELGLVDRRLGERTLQRQR